MDLKNKKVLITGATGGIGNELVKTFLNYGAKILASGTNEEKLAKLRSDFKEIQTEKFKLDEHQNIENFMACSQEDLLEINDVGPIASKFITDYLSDKVNTDVIRNLLNLGVNPKEVKIENDNLFSSKSVVITGSFNSIARSQLKEELIRLRARVNSSVSSKTDFLVVGDKPGSKLTKAKELNIRVIEEDEFLEMFNS